MEVAGLAEHRAVKAVLRMEKDKVVDIELLVVEIGMDNERTQKGTPKISKARL